MKEAQGFTFDEFPGRFFLRGNSVDDKVGDSQHGNASHYLIELSGEIVSQVVIVTRLRLVRYSILKINIEHQR